MQKFRDNHSGDYRIQKDKLLRRLDGYKKIKLCLGPRHSFRVYRSDVVAGPKRKIVSCVQRAQLIHTPHMSDLMVISGLTYINRQPRIRKLIKQFLHGKDVALYDDKFILGSEESRF